MGIVVQGKPKRVALALSGGGFRAAAFHLGVMKKLEQLGLLYKLDVISCVSGGSIAGATLALHWADRAGPQQLDTYLRTRSIAVSSVIGGVLDPFSTRLEKLAAAYDAHLFGRKPLSTLSAGPRIYFNSTNLATGNMFFFVAGENKPTEMGEYELGVVAADDFPISMAVAASSAFPPVFPPLRIGTDKYKHAEAVQYVTLCDGGVYDNMGVNPLLRQRNSVDYLIISDGGKPFAIVDQPTESGAVVLKASLDIMMEQIRGLEFDRIQYRAAANVGPKPLWFSIDSVEGEVNSGDAAFASSISTNLAKLNDAEMSVLTRHGGGLVEARIRRYAPELTA